jgi:hypothetical protein
MPSLSHLFTSAPSACNCRTQSPSLFSAARKRVVVVVVVVPPHCAADCKSADKWDTNAVAVEEDGDDTAVFRIPVAVLLLLLLLLSLWFSSSMA